MVKLFTFLLYKFLHYPNIIIIIYIYICMYIHIYARALPHYTPGTLLANSSLSLLSCLRMSLVNLVFRLLCGICILRL